MVNLLITVTYKENPVKNKIPDLEKLHELHRKGQVDEAQKGFLAYLKIQPQNAEVLHAVGLIYVEQNKLGEAADYLKAAVEAQPNNPTLRLHLANALKMQGLFGQATTLLNDTLAQYPQYAPGYNNLGTLYYAQGKLTEAVAAYRQALETEPTYIDAYYNLGLALAKNEELEAASQTYQRLLQLAPEHSAARYQLAAVYMRQEKWQEAVTLFLELALTYPEHLETQVNLASCYLKQGAFAEAKKYNLKALALNPSDPQVLFNLGYISSQQGILGDAVQYYQELVRLNPDHFPAHYNLGVLFFSKRQVEPARAHLQEALRIQPQNGAVAHLLKILKNDQQLLESPPEYLKSLFDYYADHYEPHLLNTLSYQVPQILLKAFESTRKFLNKKLEILDLGCGTGLCGETFKFHAARLVGVDLSEKMLAVAAEKNIYDELICEDFIRWLSRQKAAFDLILAGDVLVYIGDLSSAFQAIRRALRSQGLLVFNTEISTQEAYTLTPSGRFAHHAHYLEKMATSNGLTLIYSQTAVTRMQDGKPVSGHIYVLQAD